MDTDDHKSKFSDWIRSPQTMIALSAVVLSVCGLFISIYETSLIRAQQRASVWPNVEIQPSLRSDSLKIFVVNSGIGPARIMNAFLTYQDSVQEDWFDVVGEFDFSPDETTDYHSLIKGRVLPPNSGQELIFRITSIAESQESNLAMQMGRAILEKNMDINICYCSVYDECWTTRLSHLIDRSNGEQIPSREDLRVSSCSAMKQSGI
ncbi:MAG: hypothetical protein GVY08_07790 [Bacteroidetes bacterium]|jgi:hypothetical protein|nr:hypothetical protein [Bacteroidota bacterium]NBC26746.1 hypothetical protein [Bacteroidota bacterium]